MLTVAREFTSLMLAFAPPKDILRGLSQEKHFQNYHRVLNRAVWSSRAVSRVLLQMHDRVFASQGLLVMGLDDTTLAQAWRKNQAQHLP